jgi:hypothetical protein
MVIEQLLQFFGRVSHRMMCKDSTLKAAVDNSFNAYDVLLYEPEVCSKIFAVSLNHYVGQYRACCSCPLSAQLGM